MKYIHFILVLVTVYFCYQGLLHARSPAVDEQRIITLSPHLTEIIYALGKEKSLVAVSDYSNFPAEALDLPTVASYEGANIAEILRLQATHILVWRGGNKDADISKLKSLGMNVYESQIDSVQDMIADIEAIGRFIKAKAKSDQVVTAILKKLSKIRSTYEGQSVNAVYYLNDHPLVGLGNDRWLNSLLNLCGIRNIYADSIAAFPQLQISHIIRQQPDILIAANNSSLQHQEAFWQRHNKVLTTKVISANPDALHRFSPRAIDEIMQVCDAAYHTE